MVSAWLGADYILYITVKDHAGKKNDEDNSEVVEGGSFTGRNVEEMYKGF